MSSEGQLVGRMRAGGAAEWQLARELEAMTAAALGEPGLVAVFFGALQAQWQQCSDQCSQRRDVTEVSLASELAGASEVVYGGTSDRWDVLQAARPLHVDASLWVDIAVSVVHRATRLLGSGRLLHFFQDLCDPARFDCVPNVLEA